MKIVLTLVLLLCAFSMNAQLSEKEILEKGYEFYLKEKAKIDKKIAVKYDVVVFATPDVYKSLAIKDKVQLFDDYCNPPAQNDATKYLMIDYKQVSQMTRLYLYIFTCGSTANAPAIIYDIKSDGSIRARNEVNY